MGHASFAGQPLGGGRPVPWDPHATMLWTCLWRCARLSMSIAIATRVCVCRLYPGYIVSVSCSSLPPLFRRNRQTLLLGARALSVLGRSSHGTIGACLRGRRACQVQDAATLRLGGPIGIAMRRAGVAGLASFASSTSWKWNAAEPTAPPPSALAMLFWACSWRCAR